MDWLHLCSEDGVDVFQGVDNSSSGTQVEDKSLTYLRGACKIYATIDEISDFFKLDTPEKLTGFAQTVGKDLLDQKTLLTLATPTEDNPKHYVAVKWTAVESPSKLARNRDFCYIECHDEFLDTNTRRRGWVRSIHSIRLPFCPPLHRSHGLVRGSFYRSGYIFTESAEKGCVDAVHTLHVDIKGNAPNWLKIMTMKRRIKNIDQVNRYFQLRRLTQGKLLGDLELPAKDGVARCQRCETRFGFFHRKRLCRKCGKVVCTPCGNEFLLDYGALGHKKVRICVECSESMTLGDDTPAMGRSAKKTQGTDVRPVYDDSISSSLSQSKESRQFSIEEQEYYLQNEDASGIADMEDAKRMHDEFQKLLKSSQNGSTGSDRGDPLSQRHFDPNAQSLIGAASASGDTQPVDTSASDLPPWEEQVQLGHSGDYEMNGDDELGLPPSKSEQVHLQTLFEEKLRQERSQRARTMIHDPDFHSRLAATDDEAFRLAMSAMRLYEEERGHKVQVTDKTRQAALTKMMEVYAREIERSQLHDPAPRNRGPIAAAHILHEEVDTMPQIRRTVSDDRSTTVYGSPLQVYTRDEGLAMARRQRRAASRSKQEIRTNVYAPVAHRRRGVSADSHEYRDLSDLTSSAFQAFQMNSLGPRDAPKLPEAQIQSSEGSDSINDSYKPAERYPQQPSSLFQRESTSTTGMLNSKSDGPSGAGGATYGSGTSSEVPNMESRPNSLYEVPDSETFSDMDLTDLPHLMRNDDPRRIAMESDRRSLDSGARSSFTDLQRWTENSNLQALAEQDNLSITDADEYVEEPRLSDLLSPLRLEEQQQVEDDASSISSSQFEWIGSMGASVTACVDEDFESSYPPVSHQVQTASYTDLTNSLFGNNALSESMVAHDGKQPQHPNRSPQYPKQRSLSALLSEYSDSERSSLPSFAEYGAQPELEPEYIEAINNLDPKLPSELDEQYDGRQRHRQNSVPLEGAARVRRRSSIPPELEGMTKRELFL
ncbi:hypothetical protein PHYBOEH_009835 [Phytophthora boehmeriae]|uniref:FYVE-type domain-containing protein n=1 Tax=Phytophthora boehmeriae TaxID=109152 RepID=A0A8T1WYS4_9STRA|nr:hypothetical protein PHYBOEH_009835 [Phytophthora boehmeriae]